MNTIRPWTTALKMRLHEIWIEGADDNPTMSHRAHPLGRALGETFQEACDALAETLPHPDMYDPEHLTYFGCQLTSQKEDLKRMKAEFFPDRD